MNQRYNNSLLPILMNLKEHVPVLTTEDVLVEDDSLARCVNHPEELIELQGVPLHPLLHLFSLS